MFVQQFRQRRADADPLKLSMQEQFSPRQLKVEKLTTKLVEIKKVSDRFFLARESTLVGIVRKVLHGIQKSGSSLPHYDHRRLVVNVHTCE